MNRPIGIFDSGVGGLTVAAALKEELPHEHFIYFGDTRHAPYGDKSAGTITDYASRITRFLIKENCKAVVIACNSASAMAYQSLRGQFPQLPLINVIDPVVSAVSQAGYRRVGIIATRATIRSRAYQNQLRQAQPGIEVKARATPLLAALVEEGFAQTAVSAQVIEHYLSHPDLSQLDALILACTHYPLLADDISAFYGPGVSILNSAAITARAVHDELRSLQLLRPGEAAGSYRFYVSEKTPAFEEIAGRFFGKNLRLEERILSGKD